MARQPMSAISPKQILDAEMDAIRAYECAYSAMPVPQPDGTTIPLCYYARIDRAFNLLASAKGTDREPAIKRAVEMLIAQSQDAQSTAHEAANRYEGICAQANVTPKDLVPAECGCDFCKSHNLRKGATVARVDLAGAVSQLFMATPDKLPAIVGMVADIDSGSKEAANTLRTALTGIADAMRRYSQVCKDNGLQPDWRVY